MDQWSEKIYKTAKQILWPWVVIPFVAIYGADMLEDVMYLIQWFCIMVIAVLGGGVVIGAWLALQNQLEKSVPWIRLFDVIPTVRPTFDKLNELLTEVEK